ncbi:MAG: hypothetical protein RQ751_03945 [Longimicrobiales bacterium]|nr:hypothetical protein [Longimicrobiales bacterium]
MVLKAEDGKAQGRRWDFDPEAAFAALGWIGIGFLAVGGVDFLLAWYPTAFGSREWQFAVATQSFSSLPVPTLGLGMLLLGSAQTGRRWWAYLAAGVALVVGLVVLIGVVLWAMNIPLALSQVPDQVATGMYRSILRTAVQALVYPALLTYLGWAGLRIGRSIDPDS